MRAHYITEEIILRPKDKDNILNDLINIDTAEPIVDGLRNVVDSIPDRTFTFSEIEDLLKQLSTMALEYFVGTQLSDWEYLVESLSDTLKPKDEADIRQELNNIGDEIILKDGKSVWLIQQSISGMAGEPVEILTIVDDNGKSWPLSNETLDTLDFEWDDRRELVELMDDSYQTNYNNAIAYVK